MVDCGVFALKSGIQAYEWGSLGAIAEALGRSASGQPEAELWLGTHPKCPSALREPVAEANNLRTLLAARPELIGGQRPELPFLFKVLAAAEPLSLQVHPSKPQAERGFAREELSGVPIDARHRNYRDDNHKPELIFALTDFQAVCGFASHQEIVKRLRTYAPHRRAPELVPFISAFVQKPGPDTLEQLFTSFFELRSVELALACEEVVLFSSALDEDLPLPVELKRFNSCLRKVAAKYPADPGLLALLLLNVVELKKGQALYLPAGVLHAYIQGLGLEIMASSDNVLRGGLTSKHIDQRELLEVLVFEEFQAQPTEEHSFQTRAGAQVTVFPTDADDFELSLVTLKEGFFFEATGPDILLVLSGRVEVREGDKSRVFERGDEIFCSALASYSLGGEGRVARASTARTRASGAQGELK